MPSRKAKPKITESNASIGNHIASVQAGKLIGTQLRMDDVMKMGAVDGRRD